MRAFLAAVVVALVVSAMSRADLLPPGTKNIPVEHKIESEKEYPDWVFFIVRGSGGVKKVKLSPKSAIVVPGSSAVGRGPVPKPGQKEKGLALPYRASVVVAIPAGRVKEYKTEKELNAAIEDAKVTGLVVVGSAFFDHENAKTTDPRKKIVQRYRLTKLEAKEGATLDPIKEEEKPPESAASPVSAVVPDVTWIFKWIAGGLGTAAVIGIAGVFLLGRTKRR
jgi:hypothetical protein